MELVVGADFLQLGVCVHQGLPVPEPDVVDGRPVVLKRLEGKPLFRRERSDRDLPQIEGLLGKGDVLLDVTGLELELARLYVEALEQRRSEEHTSELQSHL